MLHYARIETASLTSHVILASLGATWPDNTPEFAGYLVAVLLLIPTIFIVLSFTLMELDEYREFVLEVVLPTMAKLPGLHWIEYCLPKEGEEDEEEAAEKEEEEEEDQEESGEDDNEELESPEAEESDRIATD